MAGDTQAQDGGGAMATCSDQHEDQKTEERHCPLRGLSPYHAISA